MKRRITLVCLTPVIDAQELKGLHLPSFGIRRIEAAILGDPDLAHWTVRLIDEGREDVAAYVDAILSYEPEIIGFSIYVWSAPFLIKVARAIRRKAPGLVILFGGPSARSSFFDLPPYRSAHDYSSAIVEGDGEEVITDVLKLPEVSAAALASVPGLTIPGPEGWTRTRKRPTIASLDSLVSPYDLGLMPARSVSYLETYRGCPLSCRFCEWGSKENIKAAFSVDYIERQLRSFERLESPALFLLDAGLNLNLTAFRNLREANRRTDVLKRLLFWAEIYPSVIRDEHLAFLEEVGSAYLGVGMQSMDPAVLRLHDRPSNAPQFEAAVRALARTTRIELQIIAALPGDTPAGFWRTLDYARSLPADVRVYHCLVLPDALLTRARPEWNIRFDNRDLTMRSCTGWSEDTIGLMRAELARRALASGGKAGDFWWTFPANVARQAA